MLKMKVAAQQPWFDILPLLAPISILPWQPPLELFQEANMEGLLVLSFKCFKV